MDIKKGDQIKIISGKDRGKTGTVLKVFTKEKRLSVEGLNLFKKRSRPKKQGAKGETVLVPRPLAASKIMLICQNCKKNTRTGYRAEGDRKIRFCKKCESST